MSPAHRIIKRVRIEPEAVVVAPPSAPSRTKASRGQSERGAARSLNEGEELPLSDAELTERARQVLDKAEARAAELAQDAEAQVAELGRAAEADRQAAAALRASAEAEVARLRQETLAAAAEEIARRRTAAVNEGRQVGHSEGSTRGREEGIAAGRAEIADLVGRARAIAEEAGVDQRALVRRAEREVVQLAIAVAEKLLRRELRLDPTAVTGIVDAALAEVVTRGKVRVRVHPNDYELLLEYWTAVQPERLQSGAVELVGDETIQAGGCLIETPTGLIDARLERQLDEVTRALLGDE